MDMPPQLGRYKLLHELGRGAMGVIYAGVDTRDGARVAIKTRPQTASTSNPDGVYRHRLRREAQALLLLDHSGIVRARVYGEHDGIAYLAMDRLDGETLKTWFDRQATFTTDEALRITLALLDALGHAHRRGVVHRDVKPANLMLDAQGKVTLTDFGVAQRHACGKESDNPQALLIGTPSYMSPEQILGQAVGPQADLFAAGIVLYQLLTQQRPFFGDGHLAVQRRILHCHPILPSQHNPLLSADVDVTVFRALAKHPAERYADARTFAKDLQRLRAARPVPAHAPTWLALAQARTGAVEQCKASADLSARQSEFWQRIEATPPTKDLAEYVARFPHDEDMARHAAFSGDMNTRTGQTGLDQPDSLPSASTRAKTSGPVTAPALVPTASRRVWRWLLYALGCVMLAILTVLSGR